MQARPGYIIQCSKQRTEGAHTYIVLTTDSSGICVYDANFPGGNKIRYDVYDSYKDIAKLRLGGITLYKPKNYNIQLSSISMSSTPTILSQRAQALSQMN